MKPLAQKSQFDSPWPFRQRVAMLVWYYCWPVFCGWTPKPLNRWRLFWLRLFGAKIHGTPFVHQHARVQIPWNLTMHDKSCLGDRANAYSLGEIEIGERAIVAQEVYLCTGSHDLAEVTLPLRVAKISIGAESFICARVIILPGIRIGDRAIVGAGSVVTRDVPVGAVVAGNPALVIRQRDALERVGGRA